jgi:hypothetical protein
MSESSFPFQGGQTVADGPASESESSANRSRIMLLVALAAALVLGLVAYLFLFAGGGEEAAAPAAPPAQAPVAPAEQPAAEPKSVKKEKISAKSFGRDPFEPLIVEAVATTPDTGTGTTADAGTGGAGTVADDDSSTGGSSTGSPSGGTTAPSAPSAGTAHQFKVVDVAPDNTTVTIKLDGDTYRNLKAGEVFADIFKVRFIGGQVNSFQIGDEVFNVSGKKQVTIAG